MSRCLVAIHQPNFFPWLGFFDKIARADVFVVLDHVQFPKTRDGNWTNRVKMDVYGTPTWVTMPLVRGYDGLRRIDEMQIDHHTPWRRKLLRSLQDSYGRAPHFRETFPLVAPLVDNAADLVVDYNLSAITALCQALGLPTTHLVRSSSLDVSGGKTDLLVDLVRATQGTAYLAGGGASGYQDDALLESAGIAVEYQRFVHPVYPQRGDVFVPGLSVLDAIFHTGFERTAALLRRPALSAGGTPS
jgi:hypothetical protein